MQESVRASYENGLETRSKILAVAKDLFWSKGYDATGYRDISAANGWSPGLIHYHFKQKQILGYAVYVDIVKDVDEIARIIAPDSDNLQRSTIVSSIIWDLVSKSPEFSRFMYEVSLNRISVFEDDESDLYRYREITEGFGRQRSDQDFRIRMHLAFAGERELFIDYASGDFDLDARECAALDSEVSLRLMGVPDEVIQALIEEVGALVAAHSFEVGEAFAITLLA